MFCSGADIIVAFGSFVGGVVWAILSNMAKVNSANVQREVEQAAWTAEMEIMGLGVLDVS